MKPVLLIGLGNPLMGDDAVGCMVAKMLAADPRLPKNVEVICGGPDLLRYAGQMEGRRRVVVVDALQDSAEPGSVRVFEADDGELDDQQVHAHHLSAVQAMKLLQTIRAVRCRLIGIGISSAVMVNGLSPPVEARMPAIVDRVLEEVGHRFSDGWT